MTIIKINNVKELDRVLQYMEDTEEGYRWRANKDKVTTTSLSEGAKEKLKYVVVKDYINVEWASNKYDLSLSDGDVVTVDEFISSMGGLLKVTPKPPTQYQLRELLGYAVEKGYDDIADKVKAVLQAF